MKLFLSILFSFFVFFHSPADLFSKDDKILKIGVSSMITPLDAVKYYQEIIDYIGEEIKQPVQMVHRRTYEEMDRLLEKGEVKVAFICSAPYVKNRENLGVELLVAPSVNGKPSYHSYIIVHKDSPIQSFLELKGKTFAFTDPGSNTGRLYPTYLLKKMKTTPESFFKKLTYSYSHNKSIELVAKKVVDGAAVDSIVYDYMFKNGSPYARQTRIIKMSPPFGIPPVVVTKDIDVTLKERLKEAFLKMHSSQKGHSILNAMMIDRFIQVSDNLYDSIREMRAFIKDYGVTEKKIRGKKTVYIGVVPRDNPRIMYEKYQPLLDYLSEKTEYSYELVIKKNYQETVDAIGNGEVDLAFLGPITYLDARAKYGVMCILKPKGINGTATYRSVIIKRRDSDIRDVKELKNKSVAFSDSKSTSGNLIPRYILANSGIHLSELKSYANFNYHDSVVKAVLKGQYDAGAVRDSVAQKYMKLGIDVITESSDIPVGPLVAASGTPFAIIENIKKALLALNPDNPDHKKILKRVDEDLKNGFTEASDGDYSEIRTIINAVPQTCGKGCHPKIKL